MSFNINNDIKYIYQYYIILEFENFFLEIGNKQNYYLVNIKIKLKNNSVLKNL